MYTIRKQLHKIDMFGQNITLNMNKDASYTTEFGGLSSLLIIVIVVILFFSNIITFFAKTQVYTNQETIFSNDPQTLILNQSNYMVAFSIDQSNFITNPFFNISVQQRLYLRDDSGNLKKQTIIVPLGPCQFSYFDQIFSKQGVNFTDQYNQLGLDNWLCPIQNYSLNLTGTYSSTTFEFIKLVVTECNNNTDDSQLWKPICASDDVKDAWLEKEGQFKIQMYQINAVINANKPENYLQYYLDSDMYFTFVPTKLSRQANIYFREAQLTTDESLLPYSNDINENVIMRTNEDYRDLTELGRDTDDQYAIIYLRRSPFTEYIDRQYLKIGELLSYLGGVVQIMKLLFGVVIAYFNRQLMLIELSNKLYDFREKRLGSPKTLNSFQQNQLKSNRSKLGDEIQSPQVLLEMNDNGYQNENTKQIQNALSNLFSKTSQIKVSFKLLLNYLTCGNYFHDNHSKFLKKALHRMNEDLDLHTILFRIQEINKVKNILLNEQQQIIFNFTPKPQIYLHGNERMPSRLFIKKDLQQVKNDLTDLKNQKRLSTLLLSAYQCVKYEADLEDNIPCSFKINNKIIDLMNQETKYFQTNQNKQQTPLTNNCQLDVLGSNIEQRFSYIINVDQPKNDKDNENNEEYQVNQEIE